MNRPALATRLLFYDWLRPGTRRGRAPEFTGVQGTRFLWDNLQTTEPSSSFFEPTPPPAHQVQTLIYKNLMYGEGHGVEVQARWKVMEHWSLSPGFTYANEHMHTKPQSLDMLTGHFEEGGHPTTWLSSFPMST